MMDLQGAQVAACDPDPVLTPLFEVANREGVASLAERLLQLRTWLSDDLSVFEQVIVDVEGALGEVPALDLPVTVTRQTHTPFVCLARRSHGRAHHGSRCAASGHGL
jgi:hypothetical protein